MDALHDIKRIKENQKRNNDISIRGVLSNCNGYHRNGLWRGLKVGCCSSSQYIYGRRWDWWAVTLRYAVKDAHSYVNTRLRMLWETLFYVSTFLSTLWWRFTNGVADYCGTINGSVWSEYTITRLLLQNTHWKRIKERKTWCPQGSLVHPSCHQREKSSPIFTHEVGGSVSKAN